LKTKWFFFASIFFLLLLVFQCKKQEPRRVVKPSAPSLSAGKIYPNLPYLSQGGATFALYLPKQYTPQKAWPVVYFFDAHARGILPVKRYRKLADDFGFIFVGANNLKNGLANQTIANRVDNLFGEVNNRFKIRKNQQYIMGFSGGARMAVLTALLRSDVSGVIGCAAGFPQWRQPISRSFAYVAVVGKGDFNLSELQVLNVQLDRSPLPHWLIEFTGGHEWPPMYITRKAFSLLQLDAIRNGFARSEPNFLGRFVKSEMQIIDSLKQDNKLLALGEEYRLLINALKGMGAIQSVEIAYKKLIKSKAYLKQKNQEREQALREVDLQKSIQKAFKRQDIAYLQKQYRKLSRIKAGQTDYWMAKRLIAFTSLLGYLYAQQALQKKDLAAAEAYLKLYAVTDKNNADRYYLQAWLDILQGKLSQAQQEAEKALRLGLDDRQKIFANPDFSVLQLH